MRLRPVAHFMQIAGLCVVGGAGPALNTIQNVVARTKNEKDAEPKTRTTLSELRTEPFGLYSRYGLPDKPLELGRVTPGTYCTRQFDECYRNKCRLQSPNYPGMYPRNVTCYWTIRQKEVPTSKHAMIAVSQENQHKALVKR